MRSDYQLKFGMLGRLGSLWSRHADADTKQKARAVVDASAGAPHLLRTDVPAAWVTDQGRVLVHDAFMPFVDGEFAVIGRRFDDYEHSGSDSYGWVVKRPAEPWATTDTALPTRLATITMDFQQQAAVSEMLRQYAGDWYLIPVPSDISPVVIERRDSQDVLISGIDFFAFDGYIATRLPPSEALPSGTVRIPLAYRKLPVSNSYVLASPVNRRSSRFLNEYFKKSQALSTFRKAAAEYCGLFVFQTPDFVLSATQTALGKTYMLAHAGPVTIEYPHVDLQPGTFYPDGFVVAGYFEFWSAATSTRTLAQVLDNTGTAVVLDGVLPVKGLSWSPWSELTVDAPDSTGGVPHLQLNFEGEDAALAQLHRLQKAHELQTGNFLSTALGLVSGFPTSIDFTSVLSNYYGDALIVVLFYGGTDLMNRRLQEFLKEHKPASCVVLSQIRGVFYVGGSDQPFGILRDVAGNPVLDEFGGYILAE